MLEIDEEPMFEADEYGQHRSILFAIIVATGFLTVVAGASTLYVGAGTVVGVALLATGVVLLAGAAGVASGRVDDLLFGG